MTKRLTVLGAILPILLYSQPCLAQPADDLKALQEEIEALKEGQKRIQEDLEAIKNFLRRRRGPRPFQPVVVSVGDDPFKGDEDAKVTLIDFSDYQ